MFGVHAQIAPDQFMSELYEMNLKEIMSPAAFKEIKMMSKPWEASQDEVTVVLEMPDTAADFIIKRANTLMLLLLEFRQFLVAVSECTLPF